MVATQRSALRRRTPAEYEDWYYNEATDEEYEQAMTPDEYAADYQRRAQQAQQRQPQGERRSAPPQRSHAPTRGQERAQVRPKARNVPVGVVLAIFGGALWIIGARYTLDGWVWGVNILFSWLSLPVTIPRPVSWFVLLALPLGALYSAVETGIWYRRSAAAIRSPLFWLAWLAIVGTDVFSTWLGVRNVQPDSWLLTQQVAANGWAALVWALVLTFLPEWAILGARFFLRR